MCRLGWEVVSPGADTMDSLGRVCVCPRARLPMRKRTAMGAQPVGSPGSHCPQVFVSPVPPPSPDGHLVQPKAGSASGSSASCFESLERLVCSFPEFLPRFKAEEAEWLLRHVKAGVR